jgi:tripartite ATP-independent transporter DctP family solute receptor
MRIGKLIAVSALLGAAAMALAPLHAQAQEKKLLRIHTAGSDDVGTDPMMFAWSFASYVNSFSPTVEVKVFPNSQLGQSRDVIEAMQLGSGASGTTGGAAEYATFVPKLGVLGLPFLWRDYDHVHATLDGPVGEALGKEMEAAGFKVLAWGDSWGYRNVITARKEVTKPEDLKGLKIRTIPTKVFVAAVNAMGANATPMNFGEIYTSLESGVLDGFEHVASTIVSFKFNEVTCCVALTRHLFDPTMLVLSLKEWNKLDADEQAAVMRGARFASDVVRALAPLRERQGFDQVRALGMSVNEIDTTQMRAASVAVQDELATELGAKDLLAQIRATQ